MSKQLKVGQSLYLRKDNAPMGLKIGDKYGEIVDIDDIYIMVENIKGKLQEYVNDGKGSVFSKWFTVKKTKKSK